VQFAKNIKKQKKALKEKLFYDIIRMGNRMDSRVSIYKIHIYTINGGTNYGRDFRTVQQQAERLQQGRG
jgi:hypothetical protein